VGIVIAPTQLDINPVFLCGGIVHDITRVSQKGWPRNVPLVPEKQNEEHVTNITTRKTQDRK
jgi:hypothetical protein